MRKMFFRGGAATSGKEATPVSVGGWGVGAGEGT